MIKVNHEVEKFNQLAHDWWDTNGQLQTLHHINPPRFQFIADHIKLNNKLVIDVGCGGGILCESMSKAGAIVTGIDLAPRSIEVAKLHLYESHLDINYECVDIVDKAIKNQESFDVVTCMELLEHVDDPHLIIANCAKLLKSDGMAFFSTLNRTLKSYLLSILGAEYIFKIIPKGTHNYAKFITPAELKKMALEYGLDIVDIKGIHYNPLTRNAKLTNSVEINYLIGFQKK